MFCLHPFTAKLIRQYIDNKRIKNKTAINQSSAPLNKRNFIGVSETKIQINDRTLVYETNINNIPKGYDKFIIRYFYSETYNKKTRLIENNSSRFKLKINL